MSCEEALNDWPNMTDTELLVEACGILKETAQDAHQSGQLFSQGHLHPGDFDNCRSMACEDVRDFIRIASR